ncbi:MAG: diaminopimelate dehydrogenase [Oscillospiraceae bacterium]
MKNIAIAGLGNVGLAAARAVERAPDMRLCGFIRRAGEQVAEFPGVPAAISTFGLPKKPDGVIICIPSRLVERFAVPLLEHGIFTADCFDIHGEIFEFKRRLQAAAKAGGTAAAVGAGWDPGLDSALRALLLAAAPEGTTYTDFGPGMSMGHSAAVRALPGVADAVSMTLPAGFGEHRREVYIVPENGADKEEIEHAVLSDPYFEHDKTAVCFVDKTDSVWNTGHGVLLKRYGVSAGAGNQNFSFEMRIDNPSLTGQLLAAAMRAAFKKAPGAYLFPEIAPAELLPDFDGTSGIV